MLFSSRHRKHELTETNTEEALQRVMTALQLNRACERIKEYSRHISSDTIPSSTVLLGDDIHPN